MSGVRFERAGRAGLITLDRPDALNALTHAMVRDMREALAEWRADDRVERVAIRGEGRAFCAGGDIRDVYARKEDALPFFADEYRLDHAIATFPKPYVALMDGAAMGGGVGVSLHGSHRVGAENFVFAMPEVAIGLFPDVGATHVLSRLDGHFGRFLALTGTRLDRDEAAALGLLTHPVASERMSDALDRVAHARGDLDRAFEELKQPAASVSPTRKALLNKAFASPRVEDSIEVLDTLATDDEGASKARAALEKASPTSLKIAAQQLERAEDAAIADVLRDDYRIVSRVLKGDDLYEGIRAVVIDKTHSPRFSPAKVDAVDDAWIDAHFEPCEEGDLTFGDGD